MDIVIIGRGRFGSALFQIYKSQGHSIQALKRGSADPQLSRKQFSRAVAILCVPTQSIPELLSQRGDLLRGFSAVVSTAKGLIQETGQTPSQYLKSFFKLGPSRPEVLVLSGPSFAEELQKGQPGAVVLAGSHAKTLKSLSTKLSTPQLRLYRSDDPIGVELCGAIKNVYAIGAGIAEGLGFENNTRAAYITRALSEMVRVSTAFGGESLTPFGLAGVGDLFLTCSSHRSRNYEFGFGLARSKNPKLLIKSLGTVEGVWTAAAAKKICRKHKLRTPLLDTICALIDGHLSAKDALKQLMSRKVRHEFD